MESRYRAQDENGEVYDYSHNPDIKDTGWSAIYAIRYIADGKPNPNWKTACYDLSKGDPVIIDGILCAPGTVKKEDKIFGTVNDAIKQYKTNRTPEQFNDHLRDTNCTGHTKKESNIADKAREIIYGDRESTYGDPGKNLNVIASLWSTYTGAEITAQDVCNMMVLLKVSRLKNTSGHEDSLVDIVGYTILQERIK